MRGQTRMFDGAAGAPLRRTRAEQRDRDREARAAREAALASAARQTTEHPSVTDVATDVLAALEPIRSEAHARSLAGKAELTRVGDAMQSAASRVSAGIRKIGADRALGYEDSMGLLELDSAIAAWTKARATRG